VSGREVERLLDAAWVEAGPHEVRVGLRGASGARHPAGLYFWRIRSAAGEAAGRLVLLR
jgi:hypothetical protein